MLRFICKLKISPSRELKMKPLVTNKRILIWLCLCSPAESTTTKKRIIYVIFSALVFSVILSVFAGYLTFFVKFVSIDFERSLFTFLLVVTLAGIMYGMIVIFFLRHQMAATFERLSAIYDASESN